MLEWIDWSLVPILLGVSFQKESGGGTSSSTREDISGLRPQEKVPLSAYLGPLLQQGYQYATSYLYPTHPQVPQYKITSSAYGGPGLGQQADSVYDAVTGQYLGPSTMTSLAQGPYQTSTFDQSVNDPTRPAAYNPFVLPGLDPNGLYGAQMTALDTMLAKAGAGLNANSAGLNTGVLQNALPSLMDTIGKQTVNQRLIPEQVTSQRAAQTNAMLELIARALGETGSAAGSRSFGQSSTNFGFNPDALMGEGYTAGKARQGLGI